METHERIDIEPVTARTMPPVNDNHVDVRLGDQRIDERHPSSTGAHNEVVGLDQAHPSSLRQAKADLSLSCCYVTRNRLREHRSGKRTTRPHGMSDWTECHVPMPSGYETCPPAHSAVRCPTCWRFWTSIVDRQDDGKYRPFH